MYNSGSILLFENIRLILQKLIFSKLLIENLLAFKFLTVKWKLHKLIDYFILGFYTKDIVLYLTLKENFSSFFPKSVIFKPCLFSPSPSTNYLNVFTQVT